MDSPQFSQIIGHLNCVNLCCYKYYHKKIPLKGTIQETAGSTGWKLILCRHVLILPLPSSTALSKFLGICALFSSPIK